VQSSAQDFLLTLVTDNAISYYQEARAHAWTSGFYLNDAYFRLDTLYGLLPIDKSAHRREVQEFVARQKKIRSKPALGPPLGDNWDTAMNAAQEILDWTRSSSTSTVRDRPRGMRSRP